jgi:hypothetical protein
VRPSGREGIAVIFDVKFQADADLLKVVQAFCLERLLLSLAQCGQEHPRQNRDDRNDDEQFDERKSSFPLHRFSHAGQQSRLKAVDQQR